MDLEVLLVEYIKATEGSGLEDAVIRLFINRGEEGIYFRQGKNNLFSIGLKCVITLIIINIDCTYLRHSQDGTETFSL